MSAKPLHVLAQEYGVALSATEAAQIERNFGDSELSDMDLEVVAGAGAAGGAAVGGAVGARKSKQGSASGGKKAGGAA